MKTRRRKKKEEEEEEERERVEREASRNVPTER